MANICVDELVEMGALDRSALIELARTPGLSPEEAVEVMLHRARASLAREDRRRFDFRRQHLAADLLSLLISSGFEL